MYLIEMLCKRIFQKKRSASKTFRVSISMMVSVTGDISCLDCSKTLEVISQSKQSCTDLQLRFWSHSLKSIVTRTTLHCIALYAGLATHQRWSWPGVWAGVSPCWPRRRSWSPGSPFRRLSARWSRDRPGPGTQSRGSSAPPSAWCGCGTSGAQP